MTYLNLWSGNNFEFQHHDYPKQQPLTPKKLPHET